MSDPILNTVNYANPTGERPWQREFRSRLPFEETLLALKDGLQAESLLLIHEIDPQRLAERGGYAIGATRQLLFFHPRYLVRLLEGDSSALMEAPLKLVITEQPDSSVILRHSDVAAAFQRYPALSKLGAELDELFQRLVARVSA